MCLVKLMSNVELNLGCQGGAVVSIGTFHLCDPGSIPAWGGYVGWVIGRSQSDSKGFALGTLVFLPPQNRLKANTVPTCCGALLHGHAWTV